MATLAHCLRLSTKALSIQSIRGLHFTALCSSRRSRTPRLPVDFVESRITNQISIAPVTAPIDECETPVIELSKEEMLHDIETRRERLQLSLEENESLPPFQKLSHTDKTLGFVMQKTVSRSPKNGKKLIAIEGRRIIEDAIHAGINLKCIFFSEKDSIRGLQLPENSLTKCFKVPYLSLKLWSTLTTCPGVIGVLEQPETRTLESLICKEHRNEDILPLNLICDQVRDPGNMGSILRVAAAVGCNQVITTKGCVNIWDPKVVRASMGSVFRVPIVRQQSWDELATLVSSENASVYLADHREFLAEGPREYTDVLFRAKRGPIVLIVGGETHGLSACASDITKATRIRIPLACGVESLNVGTAVAVLVYEIRRQLSQGYV